MKVFKTTFAITLIICIAVMCISAYASSETVEGAVLRIHIRANGNTQHEQEVKLDVRNSILQAASILFKDSKSLEESVEIAQSSLQFIEDTANEKLNQLGEDYKATVYIANEFFPTKHYKDISLPAGTYKALVVELGSGDGENWWCMLYPALCPYGETVSQSESTKAELEKLIGKDNYNLVSGKVTVKFKLVEVWGKIKSLLRQR